MGPLVGSVNVLKELNRVYGDPASAAYAAALPTRSLFGGIVLGPSNWQDLVAAYKAGGVVTSPPWESYISNMTPENILIIAQARFDGLTRAVAMKTTTHVGGNKVLVTNEPDGSILISSPF